MDLQSALMARGRRGALPRLLTLLCFALACALLIGSLVAPVRVVNVPRAWAPWAAASTATKAESPAMKSQTRNDMPVFPQAANISGVGALLFKSL